MRQRGWARQPKLSGRRLFASIETDFSVSEMAAAVRQFGTSSESGGEQRGRVSMMGWIWRPHGAAKGTHACWRARCDTTRVDGYGDVSPHLLLAR